MKNLFYTAIGLVVGIVIGVAASACTFNKKANETINDVEEKYSKKFEELENALKNAEEKHNIEKATLKDAIDEYNSKVNEYTSEDSTEISFKEVDDVDQDEEDIDDGSYKPADKPYVLEEKDDNFIIDHEHIYSQFTEVLAVYDKARGRVCDEDGCEVFNISGKFGWNNLNKLYKNATYIRSNLITIIDETDGYIWKVHAGDLYEYMDIEEDYENLDD